MFESLVPNKARPLAPRPYLIPTIYLTCVLGSLLPASKFRAGGVALIVSYLIAEIPKYTTGDISTDVLTPIQAALILVQWFEFYVLHSPEEFSRTRDKQHPPRTWWEKFKWSLDLNASMRGIGWNWQVKNVPEPAPPETTKWQFVRTELSKAALWYFLLDLSGSIARHSVYGNRNHPDLSLDTIPRQLLFTWIPALGSYWALVMQYSLGASLAVASGLFSPQDWPPLMGRLRDVSTVRSLWGKFWHQMLRRKLNIPYNFLTRFVPIKKGTLLSKYGQLYLAFFASGCLHALGALNVPGSGTYSNAVLQQKYFLVQPLAITFEDFMISLGKRWGIKKSWKTKVFGVIWMFVWFSWSLRYTAVHHYTLGIFEKSPMPSLVEGVLGLVRRHSGFKELPETVSSLLDCVSKPLLNL